MSDQVTAQKVAELLGDLIENIGYPVGMGMRPDPGTLERLATRALAAAVAGERERCARVAENYGVSHVIGSCIAAAIRSPETAQAGEENRE